MGLWLATHCPACSAANEAKARIIKDDVTREECRAKVRAVLPPELQPVWLDPLGTDPDSPAFNAGAWRKVEKWRPGMHGNWLALIGGAGMCKTRCLALMAEKIIMQGHRLVWTSAMRLHMEATINLRSRERTLMANAREHLAECMTTAYLVLDDLGNNEWSPAFESQLFSILDHRKNHRLPILYSSNVHPEQFSQCISSVNPAALIGRLLDRTNVLDFDQEACLL